MRDGDRDPLPPANLPAGVDLSDAAWWDEPGPGVEAAVMAQVGDAPASARRGWPRRVAVAAVGLAAAAALIAVGYQWGGREDPPRGVEFALAATSLKPEARATVRVDETPNGTWLRLDIGALPPAAEGTYYEAWLEGGGVAVSAGTFHLRGAPGPVVLWAGVSPDDHPDFVVTVQAEGAPERSDQVVLAGRVSG